MMGDFLGDQRMQQRLEPAAFIGILEDQLAQRRPVQGAVGLQYAGAEMLGDFRQRRAPGFDHPARRMIGVDGVHAQVDEMLGRCALAAADATGQAENPGFFH
ncbi:hypothetical protein D3C84_1009410 [compost metagenome]